jgi:hypothetical protein
MFFLLVGAWISIEIGQKFNRVLCAEAAVQRNKQDIYLILKLIFAYLISEIEFESIENKIV